MQRLWDVAPPETWLILAAASALLLTGFVLLSHTLVRSKAYGDRFRGVTHRGRLEWTLRLGIAAVAAGAVLWGVEWGWPAWLLVALSAIAAVAASLEGVARVRG